MARTRLIDKRVIYEKIGHQIATSLEELHAAREKLERRKGRLSQVSARAAQAQIQGVDRVAKKLGFRCACDTAGTKRKRLCYCKWQPPSRS